jgi:PAS domain S-box-containing protein
MVIPERDLCRELDGEFNRSAVAMVLHDPELRIRRINEAFRRLSGFPDEALIGRQNSDVHEGVNAALIDRTLAEQVIKEGIPVADVPLVETLAGERRALLWSADPVMGHGQVLGALCRFEVVTGRAAVLQQDHALLERAGHQVGTTLDVTHTAKELADLVVPELADICGIDLLDQVLKGEDLPPAGSSALQLRRVALRDTSEIRSTVNVQIGGLLTMPYTTEAASALLQGRTLLARNPAEMTSKAGAFAPVETEALGALDVHTFMAVPLIARGVTLGVAFFARAEDPDQYGEADVRLARDLISRAAVSIDNARLYTREHAMAITLQRSLLPRQVPPVAGLQVAYRYQPASRGAEVGGDWFDVIPLDGDQVALVVGDVTGHSINAAAAMGQLRTATAALARLGHQPEEIMGQLSAVVAEHGEETGATCLYVQYDPASRRCRLTRAGHLPPALCHPDDHVEFIDVPGGVMLGAGPSHYPATERELPPGSVLALYTDGLIERPGEDISDGMARLARILAASLAQPLDQLCDSVLADVGTRAQDDIALLLARTAPETLREAELERATLIADLPGAIDAGHLLLEYQPIVALADGRIEGFEALVRWRHPRLGRLAPDRFVHLAESAGLMGDLGAWVLSSAVAGTAALNTTAGRPVLVHINVSAAQFGPRLAQDLHRALAAHGVDPPLIVLELTETMLIPDRHWLSGELARLKATGVRVAIDDFGTGHSSLARLKDLPVDVIKIDRMFVNQLTPGGPAEMITGILHIAASLNVDVVAEGIETTSERDLLAELGCRLGQGYLYSRPLALDQAQALLRAGPFVR